MSAGQPTRLLAGCRGARFAYGEPPSLEERIAEALPSMPVETWRCARCGAKLSRYNPGEECLRHAAPVYRTYMQMPVVLCKVCGRTALSDGQRTCRRCLRAAKEQG